MGFAEGPYFPFMTYNKIFENLKPADLISTEFCMNVPLIIFYQMP